MTSQGQESRTPVTEPHAAQRVGEHPEPSRAAHVLGLATLVVLAAALGLDLLTISASAGTLAAPVAFTAVAVVAGAVAIVKVLRRHEERPAATRRLRRSDAVLALPAVYVLLWSVLGLRFYLATAIVMVLGCWLLRLHRPWWRMAALVVGVDLIVWVVFGWFLKVPL